MSLFLSTLSKILSYPDSIVGELDGRFTAISLMILTLQNKQLKQPEICEGPDKPERSDR